MYMYYVFKKYIKPDTLNLQWKKCWFEKLGSLSNGFKIRKQIKMTFGLSLSQGFEKSRVPEIRISLYFKSSILKDDTVIRFKYCTLHYLTGSL